MKEINTRLSHISQGDKNMSSARKIESSLHKIVNKTTRTGFVQKKSLLLRCVSPVFAAFTVPGNLLACIFRFASKALTIMGITNSSTASDVDENGDGRPLCDRDYSSQNVEIRNKLISCKSNVSSSTQCLSCLEDRPATSMCPVCAQFLPCQFKLSCITCKKTKPLVTMCMKYHGKEPVLRMCPCRKCHNVQPAGDCGDPEVSTPKVGRNEAVLPSTTRLLQQIPHGYRLRDTMARRERHHFRRYYRHRRRIYSDRDPRY